MKRFPCLMLSFLLILLVFSASAVQASILDWKVYETEHFVIFYHLGYEYQAGEVAYYLEQSYTHIRQLTGTERDFKTRVVIQDVGLNSNGYADNIGRKIGIFTNSPTTSSNLSGYQSWYRLVGGHEFTHMSQLSNYSGAGAVMPVIFGEQLSPNMFVPGWIIEGITVYSESQITPYEGRLRDGYEDAMIASKAAAGQWPSILETAYIHAYYPISQYYGMGGAFVRYLANTYGEEKLAEFFTVQGKNPIGFVGAILPVLGIDSAAQKVFNKKFPELFDEWTQAELAEHKDWKTDGELIDQARLGYFKYLVSANQKLYFIKIELQTPEAYTYRGLAELTEYDPVQQTERVLKILPSDTPAYLQVHDEKLYYSCLDLQHGYANIDQLGFGAFSILYAYDLTTGRTQKIFADDFKAFAVLENGDILYANERRDGHGSTLWKYTAGQKVQLGQVDQLIVQMERYQDQTIIVSKPDRGSWNISYLSDDFEIEPIIATPWAESALSIEGDQLIYTANYNAEYGIYSYDLNSHQVQKLTQGGYAYDGRLVNGDLYFKGVTPDGQALFVKHNLIPVPYELGESETISPEPVAEFVQQLEPKNGSGKNLSYLLFPQFRILPYLWDSDDGLGYTNFTIDYSSNGGLDFSLRTGMLSPLQVTMRSVVVDNKGGRNQILQVAYPLYRSMLFGIDQIDLGFAANPNTSTYAGGVYAGITGPRQEVNLALEAKLANRLGINSSIQYRHLFNQGNLQLTGSVFHQYDKTSLVRGVGTVWGVAADGITVSADLTYRLFALNKGFWNSTLYFADVYGDLFIDYASLEGGKLSCGAELSSEVGVGFWLPLIPKAGVAISKEGVRPYFAFGFGF